MKNCSKCVSILSFSFIYAQTDLGILKAKCPLISSKTSVYKSIVLNICKGSFNQSLLFYSFFQIHIKHVHYPIQDKSHANKANLIREIEVVIGSILVHSHSDTSEGVGDGNREPPVSDILSVPVLVNVSL